MKKFLAIILAAVMVFALAGAVMAEEAAEPAADFEWNGCKEVWAILPTTGVPGLMMHADSCGYEMEKEGWTYAAKDAEGTPAKQVEFVEQAISAGNVGALMIAAMDPELLEDVCGQAREAGIAINMLGVAPEYPLAGFIATAYDLTGQYAVYTAQDWLEKRLAEGGNIEPNADGKYEVAVDYYTGIIDGIYRSNAIFGTIEASDNLVAVSATQAYGNSAYDTAFSNAQSALSANPNTRIFICYEPDEAMGIAAACADYAETNGLDLADFCVIPCYSQDPTFLEIVEEVKADHSASAIKGYASYGAEGTEEETEAFWAAGYQNDPAYSPTGGKLAAILLGVCGSENYEWTYGEAYYDDITAWNVYDFSLLWQQGDVDTAEEYRVPDFMY
ncbi:MAG: substrate-binding domain-containing protein [Parasporobacterium sp.]|nr:substrate-binding domain-containing protein [Parasporobacterium sp.]